MSAIISTVTAQQWGLLNQPELQSFQKMYDEDLLSEGIVFSPVALENYYAKLGMSKTEFSFMRNLLHIGARNDKKSWFAQDQIEELFGKSRRQVQRDARKLAKEGFIIISEWDDSNNDGMHCIHYDCTPFLQMISQLVRVNRQRTTYRDETSTSKNESSTPTYSIAPVQNLSLATLTDRFFEKRHAAEAEFGEMIPDEILPDVDTDIAEASITTVSIKHNHIHMPQGKRLSRASFADMCNPVYDELDNSTQQARSAAPIPQERAAYTATASVARNETKEPSTEPRLVAQKAPYIQTGNKADTLNRRNPAYATTQSEREMARQNNQKQTRLPLLSAVVMREVSQAFRDHAPQNSQRDATTIFCRLLLINRIQDDLSLKNPDQYFSNLIKSVFQKIQATRPQHANNGVMDKFMAELNQAAFRQFEQIKIMRHQRTNEHRRYQRRPEIHPAQQPQPIQIMEQEAAQPFEQNDRAQSTSANRTKVSQRAKNFPVGEELVALAHNLSVSMTEEEANQIELGTASEQLLFEIQDAILLAYDQQPDIIANVNYA